MGLESGAKLRFEYFEKRTNITAMPCTLQRPAATPDLE